MPPLETPVNERAVSGLYDKGKLFFPKDDFQVDPGRLAFGQERLQVTPMQMAMVAAAIANGGVVMRPFVVDRVVAPDGSIVTKTKPDELGRAVSAERRRGGRVDDGGGRPGRHRHRGADPGHPGRRGRREPPRRAPPTSTRPGSSPSRPPTTRSVAVAVVLEKQSGTGGTTAAPIAKAIMEALLR